MQWKHSLFLLVFVASACSTTRDIEPITTASAAMGPTPPSRPAIACSDGASTVDSDFEGAAMAGCQVIGPGHYRLLIRQEDHKVTNCSAWYAFRVQAAEPAEVVVDLDYKRCGHRYLPKIWVADATSVQCEFDDVELEQDTRIARLVSRQRTSCIAGSSDTPPAGAAWQKVAAQSFVVTGTGEGEIAQARLAIKAMPVPQIISSQELFLPTDYDAWLSSLEANSDVTRRTLGRSLEGRAIEMISFGGGGNSPREQLVVIGRQHPPEVTGAFALTAFTERLLEDDPLAQGFRARFETTIVPMLNPDGVARGQWRHSRGERDLNRDWGPFTQPETRLMRDKLEAIEIDPTRELRFFIDFHSTGYDVLYTLDKELVTNPAGFTDAWVTDYQARLPGYEVAEQPGHNPDSPVSKAWVYERFGVPTMTYEVGDETDRDLIRKIGRAAAEATMETMLNHHVTDE
jgi:predicted deacylase